MVDYYMKVPLINSYEIQVDTVHTLYVEECGNKNGLPVVFIHGGPGGSISEQSRSFFDPDKYHLILFDQRGTGKSKPFLSLVNNTVDESVQDLEILREFFGFNQWILFGGSYGSTLALAYAIQYPERVSQLVLRGIFLGRPSDVHWLFEGGAGYFYPKEFATFKHFLPENKQNQIVNNYYDIMINGTEEVFLQACKHWSDWESGLITLIPNFNPSGDITPGDLSTGLLEAHYFANQMFWDDDNYILNRVGAIANIPTEIVHGRYDVDCRLSGAYELHQALPLSKLHIVEEGAHSPYEPKLGQVLVSIMDNLEVVS